MPTQEDIVNPHTGGDDVSTIEKDKKKADTGDIFKSRYLSDLEPNRRSVCGDEIYTVTAKKRQSNVAAATSTLMLSPVLLHQHFAAPSVGSVRVGLG